MVAPNFKSSRDAVTARAKNEDNPARQKSFASAVKQVTRRARKPRGPDLRNPKLSREQRLAILQERYQKAPQKLLEAIANNYRTPNEFAKALQKKEPLQSMGVSLDHIGIALYYILKGRNSGWTVHREPNAIMLAAANLTGMPVDDFVPVLNDGERLDDLRMHYPKASDPLLQVVVPFKTCHNFVRQLIDVEPLKSGRTTFNTVRVQFHFILTRRYKSDLKQKREPDGSRRPNDVIIALAAFTGLDHRYFLRREDGGIALKRGERIAYHEDNKRYSIVSTAPKAALRFAVPAA